MFPLKPVFALTLLSVVSVGAMADDTQFDRSAIDTSDLQATISADLDATMVQMHKEALDDKSNMLVADSEETLSDEKTTQTR